MSDEETSTGVELAKHISTKNPLISEDKAEGDLGDDELKPPASNDPTIPPAPPPSRSPPKSTHLDDEELPSSEPTDPGPTDADHVTECATAWSVVGFALTSLYTVSAGDGQAGSSGHLSGQASKVRSEIWISSGKIGDDMIVTSIL